ncbi:conserved hypothetical protein [Ricinus communis]|uniref:Uncharacterized protein n=1 Tax=Ricinus communis TaxID=3988 RepID=B9TBF8_RICCO|nr:conserved hypothetical protein [Ricinus communis]
MVLGFASMAKAKPIALHVGAPFTTARAKLYAAGWRADPAAHAATGDYDGVDRLLVHAGYFEVDYCSLGKTFCVLQYIRGNACLRLHTQGEEIRLMKVERWTDDCREKWPGEGQTYFRLTSGTLRNGVKSVKTPNSVRERMPSCGV